MSMKPSKEVNSWLIVLMVLATAFITSWAMLTYKPSQDWNASSSYPPQQVAQNLSPGIAALQEGWQALQGSWQFAAAAPAVPVLRAGAVAPHPDLGTCINCHAVVGSRQQPIPAISATSGMPHEYRGVCTNCHRLSDPSRSNTNPYGAPVAAARPVVAPPAMAPATTATEGEWSGLEVTPITALTARQYGIPEGTQGLVVAEAEAQAALAGVRAGDMLVSINGVLITQMTDFFQATRNGTLAQGIVEVVRQGQRLAIDLAQTTPPALAAVPNTPIKTEGEWLGLEVTPITALTARQYGIREGTQGLVVAEAEARAALAGVRAGDTLVSINGLLITQMTDFFQATRNGTLPQGVVEVVRQGQRLAIDLAQTAPPALVAVPNTPINVLPGGVPAAMAMPQGNYSTAPANAGAWGGGQGVGIAGGSPGACWQRQF